MQAVGTSRFFAKNRLKMTAYGEKVNDYLYILSLKSVCDCGSSLFCIHLC